MNTNNIQSAEDITKLPALNNIEVMITSIFAWVGGIWLLLELGFFFIGLGSQNQDAQSRFYQLIRIIGATLLLSIGVIAKLVRG